MAESSGDRPVVPETRSEWSAALHAADPLGFFSTAAADEVEAAREAGRRHFERSGVESTFKSDAKLDNMTRKPSKELIYSLCDKSGRLDPKKLKKFASMLAPNDPWRKQIEDDLAAGGGDAYEDSDGEPLQDPHPQSAVPRARKDNNTGELEGGADGKMWRWEQTSNGDESEILVRFTLPRPASKKEVKVSFKVQGLSVKVGGDALFDGKLHGKIYPDECTWSLVEQTASERYSDEIVHELQVLLSLAEDVKWDDLCAN